MTTHIISRGIRQSFSFGAIRALLLALAIFVLLGVIYLAQSSQATVTGQRVQTLTDQITRYDREIDQLEYEIAVLTAPARIAEIARSRGLHPASITNTVYLTVKPNPTAPLQPSNVSNLSEVPPVESSFLATLWDEFLDWLGLAGVRPAQAGQ